MNPNIALLFLVGGALLIYLEFNAPGTIVPGALGTLMVLLAMFALDLLPIRYTAVLLLLAAMVLLTAGGQVWRAWRAGDCGHCVPDLRHADAGGGAGAGDGRSARWWPISVSAAFGAITVFLVRLAVRARKRKARIGADAMVGCPATAMEALAPQGHVLVEGEIWQAEANAPVAAGPALRVVGHDQLLLQVEPEGQPASKSAG